MGKLAVYKYISFMFLVVTVFLAIITLFGLYGGEFNPAKETAMAMLVYILPFLIIGDIILLIYWCVQRKWHWGAIPAVVILCCIPYIRTLYQTGLFSSSSESKYGLKIATYNVARFGRETSGFRAEDILSELKRQNVELFCVQEYLDASGDKSNSEKYKEFFPHMAMGLEDMAIFSRYPILKSKTIVFEGLTNNSAMWADIDISGHIFRVFNVHLETTGFNRTLKKVHDMEMVSHNHVEENVIIRAIYGNYTKGMIHRAIQANIVAEEIKKSKYPVILCGDFNDVPYSYVYNTMKGKLVDGFKECGKGYMYTFRGRKKVRIDYIFHDESLVGEEYYTQEINYSDHYPVFMKIALN